MQTPTPVRHRSARLSWSNGSPRSRSVGLAWDGQGKDHAGPDHDFKEYFETEIDHPQEAFLNSTGSGRRATLGW